MNFVYLFNFFLPFVVVFCFRFVMSDRETEKQFRKMDDLCQTLSIYFQCVCKAYLDFFDFLSKKSLLFNRFMLFPWLQKKTHTHTIWFLSGFLRLFESTHFSCPITAVLRNLSDEKPFSSEFGQKKNNECSLGNYFDRARKK